MRSKRKVFMDAFLTAILVSIVWQILEMVFYGKVQPRIVDEVVWLILWRYIYLAEKRKEELDRITEGLFEIPCPPRIRGKKDVLRL